MHVRYIIQAPLDQLEPVIPHLLGNEARYDLVPEAGSLTAWRLRRLLDGRDVGRLVLRDLLGARSEMVVAPAGTNGSRVHPAELEPILAGMIAQLRRHGFALAPRRPKPATARDETEQVVLLVAPASPFYLHLIAKLEPGLLTRDQVLRRPPTEALDRRDALLRDVYAATVILADLTYEPGRAAAAAALAQKKAVIAIAPRGAPLPASWRGPILLYGPGHPDFFEMLLRQIDDAAPTDQSDSHASPSVDGVPPMGQTTDRNPTLPDLTEALPSVAGLADGGATEESTPPTTPALLAELASWEPDDARLAIYRTAATDPHASPERRFHAARVLLKFGARDLAAAALGDVARAAGPLRDEALRLLGTMGEAAHVALWALDAAEENAERSVAIARQLHAVGETTMARLRLERLAQHPDREVRFAALHALGDLGLRAIGEFIALTRTADDPRMRLDAARWLRLKGLETELVVETLTELANQTDSVPLALDALHELAGITGTPGTKALAHLARTAHLSDLRLAAAQSLTTRGDTVAAREALLAIAQGNDEDSAPLALEVLFGNKDTRPSDTEALMLGAALFSVRRRAAAQLAVPEQPEAVQQQAARVLIALDRADQALPTLTRLALTAHNAPIRRWAIDQLADLGSAAIGPMLDVLEGTNDRAGGLRLAEAVLRATSDPVLRRRVAHWLASHEVTGQAVEVLGALAEDPRMPEYEAAGAVSDLLQLAANHPRAVRMLGELVRATPHKSARERALSYLAQFHKEELPLSLLVHMAVTRDQPSELGPLLHYLVEVAPAAAQHIVEEIVQRETPTPRRWRLLNLLHALPTETELSALRQLATRAPSTSLQAVAAERMLALGAEESGLAALASLAQSAAHPEVRRRAMFRLSQAGEEGLALLRLVATRSPYVDARETARALLRERGGGARAGPWVTVARWLEDLATRLPLGWLDRLLGIPPARKNR